MWTPEMFTKIYDEIKTAGHVVLPEKLWEGGTSTYMECVDRIRTQQERLSVLILDAIKELGGAKKALKYIRQITKNGGAIDPKWPSLNVHEDYVSDLEDLRECLKLIHGDLSRARSDLKSKINLLEAEAKLGASGRIPQDSVLSVKTTAIPNALVDGNVPWES